MLNTVKRSLRPIEILLAEDNAGDVLLTVEELKDGKIANNINVVWDGVEALDYLRKVGRYTDSQRPDIVLLDLKMPRMDGHEVVREMKADPRLKNIPIVILSCSDAEQDLIKGYENNVNCYLTKPLTPEKFLDAIRSVEGFWLTVVLDEEPVGKPADD